MVATTRSSSKPRRPSTPKDYASAPLKQKPSSTETKLYPTVALSDTVSAVAHFYGFYVMIERQGQTSHLPACGFLTVAIAASFGVLRFGFDQQKFKTINGDFANFAAFAGLPTLAKQYQLFDFLRKLNDVGYLFFFTLLSVMLSAMFKGKGDEENFKLAKTGCAIVFFILPLVMGAVKSQHWELAATVALFAGGAIFFGSDRENVRFGMLKENWFHVILAICAYKFAHLL